MTALSPSSPWHPRRLVRTAVFVLGAIAIAVGAFLAVLHFQPAIAPASSPGQATPEDRALSAAPNLQGGVGPVEQLRYQEFEAGKLVSEFLANQLTPRKNGMVDVARPEAHFYLKDGQYLKVTGDTGEVAFPSSAGGSGGMLAPGNTSMPETGRLHHVHIDLFPSLAAGAQATLKVDTDNVRFDNNSLRLYTEAFTDADGREVAADRVPVVVRGDDYDMDGLGLTLRLSAGSTSSDRQLHLLEISHGIRLTIRHPNKLNSHAATRAAMMDCPVGARVAGGPIGLPLASVDAAAVPLALPAAATPLQVYRAVFNDQVRVVEGDPSTVPTPDRTLAVGDVLTLDFAQKKSAPTTTKPSTVLPKPSPAKAVGPAPTPVAPSSAPQKPDKSKPAKLGEQPITIYWTGKLRVTPCEPATTMMPIDAGQAVVRIAGRPARLTYNGMTAEAAVATYRTPDDAVELDRSEAVPVVHLSQPQKGMSVDAAGLDYDPVTSVATIAGPASLHVVEAGRRGSTLTATWSERGLLHVVNAGNDPGGIDHVDLSGDVHADDPKFSLSSHRLLLDLDTPPPVKAGEKAQPQLRRMTAVGEVVCRLLRAGQPDQGIAGDRLVVGMVRGSDGSATPRTVIADGRQLHAFDAQQALYADHLEAVLAPKPTTATQPGDGGMGAVSLESLVATGQVRAALKNGATAVADTLRETTAVDGRQMVELSGETEARVTSAKHDELVGSVLHVTDKGVVVVDGPGTLHTVKASSRPAASASAAPAGKPIDVSWVDGLAFDPNSNTADVVGHVIVRSVDPNGTVNTAIGDRAHIDLEDVPQKPGATATKKPADENLGNKQPKVITLLGHMQAESVLEADGAVVRYGRLKGERLVYTASDGVARVPGPGTLLVENHRPPTGAANGGKDPAKGKYGTMAVGWQGGMAYDQATGKIHIVGDVRVGFLQDSAKPTDGGPMQMRSDDLVIEMQKGPQGQPDKQQISRLIATGAVHLTMRTLDAHCHQVVFDPNAGLLTAFGSDAEPGRAVDRSGKGVGSAGGGFGRLVVDTNREQVQHVDDMSGSFRR